MKCTQRKLTNEELEKHLGKRTGKTSFYSLRYGINRHMSLVKNVDIMNNPALQVLQQILVALPKI
jgi:hypothetical protein